MGYRKGYYRKDGTYVNSHFISSKKNSYKNNKGCVIILLTMTSLLLVVSCSESSDSSDCPTKTCSDFATQAQAQTTYDSNRDCYKNLDADNNGIACENLPN